MEAGTSPFGDDTSVSVGTVTSVATTTTLAAQKATKMCYSPRYISRAQYALR